MRITTPLPHIYVAGVYLLWHRIFVTRDRNECKPSMTQHGFGKQLVAKGDMGITGEPLAITGLHE